MVTIERANTTNAALIADIGKKTFLESHGHSGPAADIESYVTRKYTTSVVETELAEPENIYHIIYMNGKPAGYSRIIFNSPHPQNGPANGTKLERLYILKEYYGQKLGLRLFEFIHDLSKKAGQQSMWLYVWIENQRAVEFYKRCGFKVIGHADFPISATHSNPNYLMELRH